jgi:hypothetical protein
MYLIRIVLFLLASTGGVAAAQSPSVGCKDPGASNYNPAATTTDGSCRYGTTVYRPVLKADSLASPLQESSGLQWAGGGLWTFNDGGRATLYKIDTLTGAIFQTVHLEGATNTDWEDIAFDGTALYVGDIGNNANGARTNLKIYKFPLSVLPDHASQPVVTVPATAIEVIHYRYADQPQPVTPVPFNQTPYDCEAMLVEGGAIHLFTKNWIDKTTTHYRINATVAGTYTAQPLERLPVDYLVTGADRVPDKPITVLLGYNNEGLAPHYLHLLSDYSGGQFFNGNVRRIDLPGVLEMGQAEGITFRTSTYGYISNERFTRNVGGFTVQVSPKLQAFDLADLLPAYVLSARLPRADEAGISQLVLTSGGELSFTVHSDRMPGGRFQLRATDGKVLAERRTAALASGRQSIPFRCALPAGSMVLLTLVDNQDTRSWLLVVH